MAIFNDTAEEEIRRLRRVIERLETEKGTRVITVEIAAREDQPGYLFYITAPTATSEETLGMALIDAIQKGFRRIGVEMEDPDIVGGQHVAPPKARATCYLTQGWMGRWLIVNALDRNFAWSGSRWVSHRAGRPTGSAQVSNFATKPEAFACASKAGFEVKIEGFLTDEESITCFRCGMTSFNPCDVASKYCGACCRFHEETTNGR